MKLKLEREDIFQLVSTKDWTTLIEVLSDNNKYKIIAADPVLQPLINQYFIDELLNSDKYKQDISYKYYLQNLHQLQKSKKHDYKLSDENFRKVVVKIVQVETNLEQACNYARDYPENEVCQPAILKYQKTKPKVIQHSQAGTLYVTENKNISLEDHTISLFKSMQEYHFYKAVRDVFPTYFVFPNVSFNTVLNLQSMKNLLEKDELNHFYAGLIDCVVIDPENNYKPIKFFELDSPFHDSEMQQHKDSLKDSILAKAGQKLIRIRRTKVENSERDFIQLIREALKD
jgi:hypothetical protein